jgi:hypothetical protein
MQQPWCKMMRVLKDRCAGIRRSHYSHPVFCGPPAGGELETGKYTEAKDQETGGGRMREESLCDSKVRVKGATDGAAEEWQI